MMARWDLVALCLCSWRDWQEGVWCFSSGSTLNAGLLGRCVCVCV